mmetsp:Transcript_12037/g.16342  ORF Transcript_12037/g.16342 Transcript_12037/m.16342 type:complete len:94 (-) Transcript_12037:1837-2118(-)
MKVKADKVKFMRPQILKFLKKRYSTRFSEIVIKVLNFPHKGTYDDYCEAIDRFIAKDPKEKRLLGFMLHDASNDRKLSLGDVFYSIRNMTGEA